VKNGPNGAWEEGILDKIRVQNAIIPEFSFENTKNVDRGHQILFGKTVVYFHLLCSRQTQKRTYISV